MVVQTYVPVLNFTGTLASGTRLVTPFLLDRSLVYAIADIREYNF